MKYLKQTFLILLLSLLLFTACSVDTPLTLTQKWLEAWQSNNSTHLIQNTIKLENGTYTSATQTEIDSKKNTYQKLLNNKTIEMTHMVALTDTELKEKNAEAGFWIFYDLTDTNGSKTNNTLLMIQHDGKWKVVLNN